jgi:hypothetical protein
MNTVQTNIPEPQTDQRDPQVRENTYLLVDLTEYDLKLIDGAEGYNVGIRGIFAVSGSDFDEFRSYLRVGVCAVPDRYAREFSMIEEMLIQEARDWTKKGDLTDLKIAHGWLTLVAKLENARVTYPPEPWEWYWFGHGGEEHCNWNVISMEAWNNRPRTRVAHNPAHEFCHPSYNAYEGVLAKRDPEETWKVGSKVRDGRGELLAAHRGTRHLGAHRGQP